MEGDRMFRTRRHFKKNDGAHNFYGEEENIDLEYLRSQDTSNRKEEATPTKERNQSDQNGDG